MDIPQVVKRAHAAKGAMGQQYLATGKAVAMRRWEEMAGTEFSEPTQREYETVGYVLSGEIELEMDGELAKLRSGDSWLVPAGSKHRYRVNEPVVVIEATSPPARFNERDQPPA